MKKLVILGAGSGGTMMANKMRKDLDDDWSITLIDKDNVHYYQPGYLFVPFDINKPKEIRRSKREFINPGIEFVITELANVDWDKQEVTTATEGKFDYDILIMATGCDIRPDEIEGLEEGWGNDIYGYYRFGDCQELGKALKRFKGGKLVVNIAEMPIKCPVAPLGIRLSGRLAFPPARHPRRCGNRVRHPAVRRLHQAGCHQSADRCL